MRNEVEILFLSFLRFQRLYKTVIIYYLYPKQTK
jgi:hypothetical protein